MRSMSVELLLVCVLCTLRGERMREAIETQKTMAMVT